MACTEDDLEFIENREWSPQWIVKAKGHELAVVTERIIQKPPYCIRWPHGKDDLFKTRAQVIRRLLKEANAKGL